MSEGKKQEAKLIGKQITSLIKFAKSESGNWETYSVETTREKHKDAYISWTEELDKELRVMYCKSVNLLDIVKYLIGQEGQ